MNPNLQKRIGFADLFRENTSKVTSSSRNGLAATNGVSASTAAEMALATVLSCLVTQVIRKTLLEHADASQPTDELLLSPSDEDKSLSGKDDPCHRSWDLSDAKGKKMQA